MNTMRLVYIKALNSIEFHLTTLASKLDCLKNADGITPYKKKVFLKASLIVAVTTGKYGALFSSKILFF